MRITWDEAKRRSNLKKHGLDFQCVAQVFEGQTYTWEDRRYEYSERRFCTAGLLGDHAVVVVHTEFGSTIHVISFRKANRRETHVYWERRY
ncbi:BrnT family toxin [Massilia endophytica]|uniref:BrnT family toxin n=1 Tax=Massilia endophytica TaxID=2899220 RepID=UPI001E5A6CA6|nr:BrnT family toxin [Massilia endophytica]UGQ44748.1 BrnT family toxin [Massilia endophytica]